MILKEKDYKFINIKLLKTVECLIFFLEKRNEKLMTLLLQIEIFKSHNIALKTEIKKKTCNNEKIIENVSINREISKEDKNSSKKILKEIIFNNTKIKNDIVRNFNNHFKQNHYLLNQNQMLKKQLYDEKYENKKLLNEKIKDITKSIKKYNEENTKIFVNKDNINKKLLKGKINWFIFREKKQTVLKKKNQNNLKIKIMYLV